MFLRTDVWRFNTESVGTRGVARSLRRLREAFAMSEPGLLRLPIRYHDRPLYLTDHVRWIEGVLVELGRGRYVVEQPDRSVLAIAMDGVYHYDPPGIHGPLNRCLRDPTINLLRFIGSGIAYAVPYCAASMRIGPNGHARITEARDVSVVPKVPGAMLARAAKRRKLNPARRVS